MIQLTLPYEDRQIKAGEAVMVHEPAGKEHYVTNVEYDYRQTKIVTVIELTPYDEFEGKHRSELEGRGGGVGP